MFQIEHERQRKCHKKLFEELFIFIRNFVNFRMAPILVYYSKNIYLYIKSYSIKLIDI